MSNPVICTIIGKNYLAAARCLTDSFLTHHPDGQVYVLVVDEITGYFEPQQERFTTVRVDDLGLKDFKALTLRYTMLELSTAVKPFFLEYLFGQPAHPKVCYFDPDIYFYQPIHEIWRLLDTYGIVLIPHLLDFLDDEFRPSELDILRAGCYNLGFIGLAQHPELDRFLHWWQQKLLRDCVVDFEKGFFVDQKWMDLAPSLFSSVYIHRDPGCNVAYWNLNRRHIKNRDGIYTVNDVSLKFFHFSGFSPTQMEVMSKHQDRFTPADLPAVKPLFEAYRDSLLANNYLTSRQWPYTYGYHDELGVKIPDVAHAAWREWESKNPTAAALSDNFSLTDFLAWLNQSIEEGKANQPIITRLAWAIYQQRPDLQRVYPDVLGWHRQAYIRWFLKWAKTDYNLDDFFLKPMQKAQPRQTSTSILRRLGQKLYLALVNLLFTIGIGSWLEQKLGENKMGPVRRFFLKPPPPVQKLPIKPISRQASFQKSQASFGLNVVGYLCDETGVGEAARAALRALHQKNFPVAYTIVTSQPYRQNDHSVLHLPQGHPYAFNCFYVNADQAKTIYDELSPQFFAGKHNIGYWHWELSRFPAMWLDRFQYFDEIWVASNFGQNAVAQVSPVPVVTIGNSVEKRPHPGLTRHQLGLPEDKFLFLFVFDMFSFIERKNPFGLIEAYRRAFGEQAKETQLVIKVNNLEQFPQHQAALAQGIKSISGILLDNYLDREDLNGLFHLADAYISLHRSEGFGMTMAEAMNLGKPTIATAYSANTDFMTVTNSYQVGYQLVELQETYGPYQKGQVWAEPDLDHAAAQMRRVVENPVEASCLGAQAAADIQRLYSSQAIAQKMIQRLEAIAARP